VPAGHGIVVPLGLPVRTARVQEPGRKLDRFGNFPTDIGNKLQKQALASHGLKHKDNEENNTTPQACF
jgi:hypothetical protein